MKCVGAAAGGNRYGGARVAAFFGGGVGGGYFVLFDIVWIQPVNIVGWIIDGRFIGVNAINGYVVGHITGAIDVNSSARRAVGTLQNTRFQPQQSKWISPVERKIDDRFLGDNIAQRGVGGFDDIGKACDGDGFGYFADFKAHVDRERRADGENILASFRFLEPGNFYNHGVTANGEGGEGVDSRCGCGLAIGGTCGIVLHNDGCTGNDAAAGIGDRTRDGRC